MTRESMSYGVLPSYEDFETAFNEVCPWGYRIVLGNSDSRATDGLMLGDGTWSASELWEAIQEIMNHEDSERMWADNGAIELVSCIMETLGFEWI